MNLPLSPDHPDVRALVALLNDLGGWLTAAEIRNVYPEWTERRLRDFASASGGRVISGQLGYRHIRHASDEEIHRAQAWLRSQADKMRERADEISAAKLLNA